MYTWWKSWNFLKTPAAVNIKGLSVLCPISVNFPRLSQPLRKSNLRDFNLRFVGIILRFLHAWRLQYSSFSRSPIDWWTSTKFSHPSSSNSFIFGAIAYSPWNSCISELWSGISVEDEKKIQYKYNFKRCSNNL